MGQTAMTTLLDATTALAPPVSFVRTGSAPPVRLFGQYLIDQGVIEQADLDEALGLMRATNLTLGDLAVERGWVTRHEAEEINRLQRCIDGRWGEIALTLGVGQLTAESIEELRWEQQSTNLRLTDALVELGLLSATEVEDLLDRFETQQLSSVTARLPSAFQHSCAYELLDVLPRVIARVLRSPVRFGPPQVWDDHGFGTSAALIIDTATERLSVGLSVESSVAESMGARLGVATFTGPTESTELWPEQAVAEFLKLLGEHISRRLEAQTVPLLQIRAPEMGQLPHRGLVFTMALASGQAVLVIDRQDHQRA